jgi:hypothetical protein
MSFEFDYRVLSERLGIKENYESDNSMINSGTLP